VRKVSAIVWSRLKRERETIIGEFHCWGQAYEEFEAGPGNRTMAIIELEDGKVVIADPEDVTFIREALK
jgi:hypothetical protein